MFTKEVSAATAVSLSAATLLCACRPIEALFTPVNAETLLSRPQEYIGKDLRLEGRLLSKPQLVIESETTVKQYMDGDGFTFTTRLVTNVSTIKTWHQSFSIGTQTSLNSVGGEIEVVSRDSPLPTDTIAVAGSWRSHAPDSYTLYVQHFHSATWQRASR